MQDSTLVLLNETMKEVVMMIDSLQLIIHQKDSIFNQIVLTANSPWPDVAFYVAIGVGAVAFFKYVFGN